MNILICPGIHSFALTQSFVEGLELLLSDNSNLNISEKLRIFPAQNYKTLSALHILRFLQECYGKPQSALPLVLIGFSAGNVGAIGAAWGWQMLGGRVQAVIAIDGWGVPLVGNFPIHRLSHDRFTHDTALSFPHAVSALLNFRENPRAQKESFYADPAVDHLEMWRSPATVTGWIVNSEAKVRSRYLSAAEFLHILLKRYQKIE